MHITRIALTDFRNHADALIAPGPGLVVLTGENGAGKTNVLEAISLLAPGRGLRGASLAEMARQDGGGGFAVAGRLEAGAVPGGLSAIAIGTGTTSSAPDRRQVRINGAVASATSLAEWLSILWLTPAMDRLFAENAGGRRRFLDRLVLALQPAHASHSARYEAAMRARNKLLGEAGNPDPAWLDALEAAMADHGAAIAEAREQARDALSARLAAAPDQNFARPSLGLGGWRPDRIDPRDALHAELRRGRTRDAAAGRTMTGPHRTDLLVTHAATNQAAALCSTGEQKALLLSIILAHAELVADQAGRSPILLLDEVAAHLDPSRRADLFERLEARGGQVWMTGTEASLFEAAGPATAWIQIGHGTVTNR